VNVADRLAIQFPREFEAAAKARGIAVDPNAEADEDINIGGDEEEEGGDLDEQAKVAAGIVALNAEGAVKAITDCDSVGPRAARLGAPAPTGTT
jgi:hypothetical protein